MKQGEAKAFVIGNGAMVIRESSNRAPGVRLPRISIVMPPVGEDGVFYPSEHVDLYDLPVRQLYEALRWYFEDDDRAHDAEKAGKE